MGDKELFENLKKLYEKNKINIDELYLILRLRNIINHEKIKNPKVDLKEVFQKIEDDFFKKYNCITDEEKIEYELKYIKARIALEEKKTGNNNEYEFNGKIIDILSKNDYSSLSKEQLKIIKRCLLTIELEMDIPISFYSEVINLYNEKMESINKEKVKEKCKNY